MHDYDDDEGSRGFAGVVRLLCVLAVGIAGGFAIRPLLAGNDDSSASDSTSVALAAAPSDTNEPTLSTESAPTVATSEPTTGTELAATAGAVATSEAVDTTEPVETTAPLAEAFRDDRDSTEAPENTNAADEAIPETIEPPETTDAPETTEAPGTTEAVTTTTDASEVTWASTPPADPAVTSMAVSLAVPTTSTAVESTADTTAESTTPVFEIPYDTMPDGSPEPVVVTFGPDVITLTGAVPSAEAAAFLSGYAAANSQNPGLPIDNRLEVNPAVPIGVGVRVIELESPRFADGSAEITAEHSRQLDRVAGVMQAIPKMTVVVVGHADQRGSAASNLDLSQERADAVIAYLADRGVEGWRMSARAVGEADLLSTSDDVASLTLNRRTEFIFFGVLLTDPATLGLDDSAGRG